SLDEMRKTCMQIKSDIIEPEIAKLNLAYQRIVKTKSFSAVGATVSVVALSAAALLAPSIAAYVALLGSSGVVLTLTEWSEYQNNKQALKENPYYLLWRMKMRAR
ncbi:MAG: hypothetical protein NTW86_27775, partial [Candidatus Sumerlaeota bacterium]|nr:hypothetical protein [Candidatus Sumerlaeota bacterium]